jgi:hypothetical protein
MSSSRLCLSISDFHSKTKLMLPMMFHHKLSGLHVNRLEIKKTGKKGFSEHISCIIITMKENNSFSKMKLVRIDHILSS